MSNQSKWSSSDKRDGEGEPKITEDAPRFASVMLAPPPGAMVPPPQSLLRSEWDGYGKPKQGRFGGEPVQQTANLPEPTPVPAPWIVATAPALPSYHRLERSHAVIPKASAQTVADRISYCLRKESVAAVFDDKQALARVETKCNMKCAVRLWSVNDQVVVECQKISGCCFVFVFVAKAILNAARGIGKAPVEPKQFEMPRSIPDLPEVDWDKCTAEALDIACVGLRGNYVDAHLIAMESLVHLSAAYHCKSFCARSILKSGNELLSTIVSLIQANNVDLLDNMEQEHCKIMHRHALTILANCLAVAEEWGTAEAWDLPEVRSQATIDALVRDVADAANKPHEAATACRCLQSLPCREIPGIRKLVSVAQNCRHAALEEECAKFLQSL